MRSSPTLIATVALASTLGLGLSGCTKKSSQGPVAPVAGGPTDGVAVDKAPQGEVEMLSVHGSFEGIDDMMVAFGELSKRIDPEQASDPKAELQAMLLQMGFGPGFLGNIELGGVHAFAAAFPRGEAARPDDGELSATIAVSDPRAVIESTPPAFRPQPLGEGVWELRQNENRVLLREAGKELLVGMTQDDLSQAATLRGQIGQGRRVRVQATNIPVDDIDPVELLGLPAGSKLTEDVGRIIRETTSIELELDFGTESDTELLGRANAPFHVLGLEPLGGARTAATALEGRLPGDAVFVTTMSWGDPALIHELMNKHLPVEEVPGEFRGIVKGAVSGMHTVLDQVANDVVLALYVDKKGKAAVLLAADVKDDAKTREGMRGLNDAIAKAVEGQATLAGKNKDGQFKIEYKPDGIGFSGGRADKLDITIPKDFQSDFEDAEIFLTKNRLQTVSFVRDKTAVVLIGAAGRQLAADIAKRLGKERKDSLAADEGLGRVREAMGGCQVCMSGDPLDYLRLRLLLVEADANDKATVKKAKDHLGAVRKLDPIGASAVGLKVERDAASVSLVIPKQALDASPESWAKMRDMFAFVDDPAITEAGAAPGKPDKPVKPEKPAKKAK